MFSEKGSDDVKKSDS